MRGASALLAAILFAAPVAAQDLPALYDVTGVAADDVLNVREGPSASSTQIGTLAPDASDIEVSAIDGGWGRVNTQERSGWASLSFLSRQAGQWAEGLPDPQTCFGTEPFWSLDISGDMFAFQFFDKGLQSGPITLRTRASGRPDRFAFAGEAGAERAILVMGRAECSDGMSDRLYGLTADFLIGDTLYSGCCSVAPD
ncbi:Bacterial SH3 domain protein [Roseivivax sp. THAF40]|uniref:COG3650 family protein n=1 Tax=unclassified Roseivivax TaxID=2639302 RepID=UPI001269293B|nr:MULTISPECIES: SH3 domain-containing protein [unclassified Roseivivax]QFS84532.1 Bacterial SH3 domain protein [Roseivivax sp. THAF197b]QFT48359.1 Bacterial SH3 domain protein [Roseivivax sp. THAF40]